jgi:Tfp pilus assembly protein PilO
VIGAVDQFGGGGISTGSIILIVEVGGVLIAMLGFAYRTGARMEKLALEQKTMASIMAETRAKLDTMQSVEIERLRNQIQALATSVAVLQATIRVPTATVIPPPESP